MGEGSSAGRIPRHFLSGAANDKHLRPLSPPGLKNPISHKDVGFFGGWFDLCIYIFIYEVFLVLLAAFDGRGKVGLFSGSRAV